jgi:hypothetical protein
MSNRFYLASSVCFLTGAILAFKEIESVINGVVLLGSGLFFVAAALSVFGRKGS